MWKEYTEAVSTPLILSLLREDSKYILWLVQMSISNSLCLGTVDLLSCWTHSLYWAYCNYECFNFCASLTLSACYLVDQMVLLYFMTLKTWAGSQVTRVRHFFQLEGKYSESLLKVQVVLVWLELKSQINVCFYF